MILVFSQNIPFPVANNLDNRWEKNRKIVTNNYILHFVLTLDRIKSLKKN